MDQFEFQGQNFKLKGNTYFSGDIFIEGEYYSGRSACELFEQVQSRSELYNVLNRATGSFAAVTTINDLYIIIPDQISSIKIFYTECGNYISDTFEYVKNMVKNRKFDMMTGVEFLLSGYVPGPNTLHPNIKQTRPGEMVLVDKEGGGIKTERYYKFEPKFDVQTQSNSELYKQLSSVLVSSFERMKTVFNDKPVIISLTDGYDSKLIAHALNDMKIDVYTYTYSYNTWEPFVDTAKSVANNFDYPWCHFIHTNEEFKEIYNSKEFQKINYMSGGEGTIHPKPSTVANIKKISNNDLFPDEGVILEGHTIAEAGKRLASSNIHRKDRSLENEVQYLVNKNYYRKDINERIERDLRRRVKRRILENYDEIEQPEIKMSELWYYDQRLPNRLLIPRQIYKHFGYDTWYPFCDREYLNFYSDIQIGKRYKRNLFESYTDKKDEEIFGERLSNDGNPVYDNIKHRLENKIKNSDLEPYAKAILNKIRQQEVPEETYRNEAGYGIIDQEDFINIYSGSEGPRYFLSLLALVNSDMKPQSKLPSDFHRQYKYIKRIPQSE